jgi:phospholipid/cholesterol/gamma-HCH transport system substrate-binding protein
LKIEESGTSGSSTFLLSDRAQKSTYISVPLMLLFRTDFIGDFRYFGKFGIRNSFMVSSKFNDYGQVLGSSDMVENNNMIGTTIPISLDDMLLKLKNTTDNAALITDDLAAIMGNIRSGKGTIGKLFMDTVFADNLDKTIVNVKQGTKGFKQNMDAAKSSFLLRGFFKKKDKKDKK